ncbi:NAD+ synthase [Caldiplasma sukawensis]
MIDKKIEEISSFLTSKIGDKSAVLGLSSGIDSTLVLYILKNSIDAKKIHAIFMPSSSTKKEDYEDIDLISRSLNIPVKTIKIDDPVNSILAETNIKDVRWSGNLKSRIRMSILYLFSNSLDGLVIGTTNLSEYITGYYTKFGDGACDIEPIINLTKSEVREAAKYLGIPKRIIDKPPSAGLWENQTDEGELGMTYDEIDEEINFLRKNKKFRESKNGNRLREMYEKSAHKRRLPISPEDVDRWY